MFRIKLTEYQQAILNSHLDYCSSRELLTVAFWYYFRHKRLCDLIMWLDAGMHISNAIKRVKDENS